MAKPKVKSIWDLQVDPEESLPEGAVTEAVATRLGVHVGAKIRALQEVNEQQDTKIKNMDEIIKKNKKPWSLSSKNHSTTPISKVYAYTAEKDVIIRANEKQSECQADSGVTDELVSYKQNNNYTLEYNPSSEVPTKIDKTEKSTIFTSIATPPINRNIIERKKKMNRELTSPVGNKVDKPAFIKNGVLDTNISQVELTKIKKLPIKKDTIKSASEDECNMLTSPEIAGAYEVSVINNDRVNEKSEPIANDTSVFYLSENKNIKKNENEFKKFANNASHNKVVKPTSLQLNKAEDMNERKELIREETIHLKTIETPEQTLEIRLTVADVPKTSNFSPTDKTQGSFDLFNERRGSMDTRRGSVDTRRSSINTRQDNMDTRRGSIDTRRGSIDTRRDSIDTRRGSVDTRRDSIDTRRGSIDTRRDSIDTRRGSIDTRRGSVDTRQGSVEITQSNIDRRRSIILSPELIKIFPGYNEGYDVSRRNSEPFTRSNRSFSITSDCMSYISEDEDDFKRRGSFFSEENLEAMSLKLDAIVVNAEYLESRAREGEERHELEEEATRTQAALDDVAVLDRDEMQERVTRAARALARCRMALEERAPSIATHEPDGDRRRSSVASEQIVRSVALRVMALERKEAASSRRRTRTDSYGSMDDTYSSMNSRRGSLQDVGRDSGQNSRRGSLFDYIF